MILTCSSLVESGEQWPPRDWDTNSSSNSSPNGTITDKSPWTYNNDSLNPNLQPSNSQSRRRGVSQTPTSGASSLPPYHPDYKEGDQGYYTPGPGSNEGDENSDEQGSAPRDKLHVRRGSEGYEVRPEGREEMLRKYLAELGEEPGRYVRYIPEPSSEESEENVSEDDVPLAQHRETIRQQ